ncbi:MAG TPA: DNA methyltransferase, partial [Gemmataceae bacterium]|nr:DNA methyltransferase [Gemmataceae bacterium]
MPRADAGVGSCRPVLSFVQRYRTERDRLACVLRGCRAGDRNEWAACLLLRLLFASYLHSRNLPSLKRGLSRRWLTRALREIQGQRPSSGESVGIDLAGQGERHLLDFLASLPWNADAHYDPAEFSTGLETLPERADQKRPGVYATSADVADYLARNTILPFLLSAIDRASPDALRVGGELRRLLQADPDRYLHEAVHRGTHRALPAEIVAGLSDVSVRAGWNRPVPPTFGPPSETWRTHLARRQRCHDLRQRLRGGELYDVADLIACNLDVARLVGDLLDQTTDPRLLLLIWNALRTLSVLDPTCGTGAFLFAALRTLEPLYAACLRRTGRSSRLHFLLSIVRNNLHGVDLLREAVEICRLRLRLELASAAESRDELSLLCNSEDNLHVGNVLLKAPDILPRDGFDVVLGNPPYLEMREVDYAPHGYICESTGAVHALCVERGLQLLQPDGYLGMVLPLAVASTQRMRCVQRLLEDDRHVWYAHFSWRPAKLFSGVNRAMTTVISTRAAKPRIWSTPYQKWRTNERESLMERIAYIEILRQRSSFWVPKLGAVIERGLLAKLLDISTVVGDFLARPGAEGQAGHIYYRTDGGLYWKVFTEFPPAFRMNGRAGHSTRETRLAVADPAAV